MSQSNTLFSYFKKSPKGSDISNKYESTPGSKRASPHNGHTPVTKTPKRQSRLSLSKGSPFESNKTSKNLKEEKNPKELYQLYDIVWAKIDGYPWWPALLCVSPDVKDKGLYCNLNDKNNPQFHIQFFDNPPTRAWVKLKNLKLFKGRTHMEIPSQKDVKWKDSVERALEAFEKTSNERSYLVATFDHELDRSTNSVDSEEEDEADISIDSARKRPRESDTFKEKKRRRIFIPSDDSDSDDEFKPDIKDEKLYSDESIQSLFSEEEETPVKVAKKKTNASTSIENSKPKKTVNSVKENTKTVNSVKENTKNKLSNFNQSPPSPNNSQGNSAATTEEKNWLHLSSKHDWLKEENRKDIKGRPFNHPEYDPRTLFVPESYLKTVSPGIKQWWELKSKHFDTILFFKVGKFYELYHMDAVIGVNELGLSYMKGDFAHAGFPEIAYGRFSEMLIQKGHRVARVEQTETPQMMEERNKKAVKKDKVVRRELCRVTTKGTRTFNFMEGDSGDFKNNYLLAITEKDEEKLGECIYGICFIDTSIGKFRLGQFQDDRNCSRLRTLIAHYPPAQVLYDKSTITSKTHNILNNCLASALKEPLRSNSEFWDSTKTLKFILERRFFTEKDESSEGATLWPETLTKMMDPDDCLQQTASEAYDLAIRALGACIWYLKMCLIEDELLTMKNFEEYIPPDKDVLCDIQLSRIHSKHMVLDGVTLANLEIMENESGRIDGTLLDCMDFCATPFGKRLFRQWLCSPLCNPDSINDRLDAIEDLETNNDLVDDAVALMKKLPDLERLLSKVHTQGSERRSTNHPDSRAIFFEDEIYSKRKICDFIITLQGFKTCSEIVQLFTDYKLKLTSEILTRCIKREEDDGCFPDIKSNLNYFDNAFDHEKAKKEGKIIPSKGVDNDFDEAESSIKNILQRFQSHLQEQSKHFGCKVSYFGTGKNRYQIEVPDSAAKRATSKHDLQSQKKGYKRYWTPETKDLIAKLTAAEDERENVLKDIMRRIFAAFDDEKEKWEAAVHCIAVLDVLISLTQYKKNSSVYMSRPELLMPKEGQEAFLEIREGQHASLVKVFEENDFIPNDILIGPIEGENSDSSLVLVTGPNMGGKSTLMRQAGLLVIMAQMGSFVPAEKCKFTVVDRIFTRLGASDRIVEGESTFFVELSETASILQHASKDSLILLDELGRGTATYDGTAIAYAVVKELAENKCCRTLFSTHYHCLVDEFRNNSHIALGHMSCMVENENQEDPTQETITFLYKFASGACPKSYGFNAARLAGIPDSVIRVGYDKAKEFEQSVNQLKQLRAFMGCNDGHQLKAIQMDMEAV